MSGRRRERRDKDTDSGAFKITPRFERRFERFNSVYEEEFFHSYDARIVEIFEIDQKL